MHFRSRCENPSRSLPLPQGEAAESAESEEESEATEGSEAAEESEGAEAAEGAEASETEESAAADEPTDEVADEPADEPADADDSETPVPPAPLTGDEDEASETTEDSEGAQTPPAGVSEEEWDEYNMRLQLVRLRNEQLMEEWETQREEAEDRVLELNHRFAEVLAHHVAAEGKRQAARAFRPPDPEVDDQFEIVRAVGELPLVDDQPRIGFAGGHRLENAIERYDLVRKLLSQEQSQCQEGRRQRSRYGDGLPGKIVHRHGTARDDAGPVAVTHAGSARHQGVPIGHVGVGMDAHGGDLEFSFEGAAIQRFDAFEHLLDVVGRRIDLARGDAVEHECVVGVGTVADAYAPGFVESHRGLRGSWDGGGLYRSAGETPGSEKGRFGGPAARPG